MKKLLLPVLIGLAATQAHAGIRSVTAVSEPTPFGQKVTAAVVEYDETVRNGSLKTADFTVADRTITRVYAAKTADPNAKAANGKRVIIRLSPDDPAAAVTEHVGHEPSTERKISLSVAQVKPIRAANGKQIAPERAVSSKVVNLVADDFTQHEFKDPASGIVVKYNLYKPKHYNPKKSYPLVMFIHDAGSTNSNVRNTLWQGNGATVWASPAFQSRHEAFVLAPQYDHVIVNDNSDDPVDLDPTINLIKSLTQKYNIDTNRLYTTGQSGGAMMSIAMNIKYPDFFAASYIVAGQWAAEKTPPMAKNKLFILVSRNDTKAYPGENAIIAELEKHGGVAHETTISAQSPMTTINRQIKQLLAKGGNIHYAVVKADTLPAEIQAKAAGSQNPGSAHTGTWKFAYDIAAIQDWLFAQRKR